MASRATDGTAHTPGGAPHEYPAGGDDSGHATDTTDVELTDTGVRHFQIDFVDYTVFFADTSRDRGTWSTHGDESRQGTVTQGTVTDDEGGRDIHKTASSGGSASWFSNLISPFPHTSETGSGSSTSSRSSGSEDDSSGRHYYDPTEVPDNHDDSSGDSSGQSTSRDLSASRTVSEGATEFVPLGPGHWNTTRTVSTGYRRSVDEAGQQGDGGQHQGFTPLGVPLNSQDSAGGGGSDQDVTQLSRQQRDFGFWGTDSSGIVAHTTGTDIDSLRTHRHDQSGGQGSLEVNPDGTDQASTRGGALDTDDVVFSSKSAHTDLGADWNEYLVKITQRPKYHSEPETTREYRPAAAGEPHDAYGYLRTLSGTSDVTDFEDYDLFQRFSSHGAVDPTLSLRDVTKTKINREYDFTRDGDDVTLILPDSENRSGITGGSSPHSAGKFRISTTSYDGDYTGTQTNTHNPLFDQDDESHQVTIHTQHVDTLLGITGYVEGGHYNVEGDKLGGYHSGGLTQTHTHTWDDNWKGSGTDFVFPPYYPHFPSPSNSLGSSRGTTTVNGTYTADDLTETVYDLAHSPIPVTTSYPMPGLGAGDALGPQIAGVGEAIVADQNPLWEGTKELFSSFFGSIANGVIGLAPGEAGRGGCHTAFQRRSPPSAKVGSCRGKPEVAGRGDW